MVPGAGATNVCHFDYTCTIPDALTGVATCDGVSPNRKLTMAATSDTTKTGIHSIGLVAKSLVEKNVQASAASI